MGQNKYYCDEAPLYTRLLLQAGHFALSEEIMWVDSETGPIPPPHPLTVSGGFMDWWAVHQPDPDSGSTSYLYVWKPSGSSDSRDVGHGQDDLLRPKRTVTTTLLTGIRSAKRPVVMFDDMPWQIVG